jgi:hypothetical protein
MTPRPLPPSRAAWPLLAAAASASRPAEAGLLQGLFSRLAPPTGRPVGEIKKLNAPDQGIPLPTSATAASAPKP